MKEFFDAANESVAAVNRKIIDITQRNLNLGLDLARSLAGARNPFEIVELLASYCWKQFDELTTQVEEVRNRLFGLSAAEPKTFEPSPGSDLQEPAKSFITRLQKGHSPTVQDATTARPKLNSDTQYVQAPPFAAGTAGSGVRAPDERQLRSRKKSTAENKSTSLQRPRPTSQDPAVRLEQKPQAATTKSRARSSSGPVTRPGARPDRERESRTQRKGAPKKPDPQNLSTDIKFGMLDGNPVRFSNFEAWVAGRWRLAADLSRGGSLKCCCDERSEIQAAVPSGASSSKQGLPVGQALN
jgi:Phasin protein